MLDYNLSATDNCQDRGEGFPMTIRINPRRVAFQERVLSADALRRSYGELVSSDEPPQLTYIMLEGFLVNNSVGDNLLLRLENAKVGDLCFFTVIRNPSVIRIQYFNRIEGFNVEVYGFDAGYPDSSSERRQDAFLDLEEHRRMVYGLLYALERYYDRWFLG
jgi:hypothetical protein